MKSEKKNRKREELENKRKKTINKIANISLFAGAVSIAVAIAGNMAGESTEPYVFDSASFAESSMSGANLSDDNSTNAIEANIVTEEEFSTTAMTTTELETTITEPTTTTTTSNVDENGYTIIQNELCIEYGFNADFTNEYIKNNPDVYNRVCKYAEQYQVDPALVMAVMMQESRGDHNAYLNRRKSAAIGAMQIEYKVYINKYMTCYNYKTGKLDKHFVNYNAMKDLDTNIKLGIMELRNCLDYYDYNIWLGLEGYNHGCWGAEGCVREYANDHNKKFKNVVHDFNDFGWVPYFKDIKGDPNYLSNVLQFLNTDHLEFRIGGNRKMVYHITSPSKKKTK